MVWLVQRWFVVLCFLFVLFHFQFDSSLCSSLNSSTLPWLCPPDQNFALIQFKNTFAVDCSFSFECYPSYPKTSSWEEATDCCLWDGVTCDAETGFVIGLDLSCSCLRSTIPTNTSLVILRGLRKLNLAFNHFNRSLIPSEFGQFASLTHLNVSSSYFSGLVPAELFSHHLPKLVSLDLSWNDQLRFERHSFENMLANLTRIRHLFLYAVNLSSVSVTSLLNLSSSIVSLSLGENQQHGKLPEEIFQFPYLQKFSIAYCSNLEVSFPKTNWSSPLRSLELSFLTITGKQSLPNSIGQLTFLEVLNLPFCNLKGSIPASIGNLTQLTYLELSNNQITGQIPPLFSKLNQLIHVDLSFNQLDGEIPNAFANLSKLFHLSLSYNQLSSHLPFSVFDLSNIQYFDASQNKLVGTLPSNISGLSKLRNLYLSGNFLNGRLPPWLFNLPSLINLVLDDNKFTGFSDHFEQTTAVPLEYVYSQNNELHGQIPSSIFALVNLSYIDLSSNRLTGISEPKNVSKLDKLEELNLSNNAFLSFMNGSNASFILASNLWFLNLSRCNITEFPHFVTNLEGLEDLDISYNRISVIEQADMFSNLKNLSLLDLSHNSQIKLSTNITSGLLPNLETLSLASCSITEFSHFVRNLEGLQALDLSHNRIRVIEADVFSRLKNLRFLDFSHNSELSLNRMLSLPLPNLELLYLSSCNITQFPNFLRTLEKLFELDLSNNSIHGKISKWESEGWNGLSSLDLSNNYLMDIECYPGKNVSTLNLRSNLLEGPLLVPPPSTTFFLISKIKLRGKIPPQFCSLNSLQILDLSDNNLSGTLPNCLGAFNCSLRILDLHKNKFHGNIPDSFSERNMLQTVDFGTNDLDGPLPESLVNCSQLEVLNVGNNRLKDTFPHWLGFLPQLKVLVLRANNFHGQIMSSNLVADPFLNLRVLDISHNEFSGPLPAYFESFKSMINSSTEQVRYLGEEANGYYHDSMVITMKSVDVSFERILTVFTTIDMSSNHFRGEIPEIIGKLTSLQVLNFSHNNLAGHIPSSMGNLKELESLDLSSNKLTGQIPTQLDGLGFLAVFNVSQNQLVGSIPAGSQFNTFPNDSYTGNLGLCGFPLSNSCSKPGESHNSNEKVDSKAVGFEWKATLIGYGCGLVFGISATYIMFTLGKPFWLVKMVEEASYKSQRYLRGRLRNL